MFDLDAGQVIEKLHRKMRPGAEARRRIGELARPRPGERDHLLQAAYRQRGMCDEKIGHRGDLGDRHEVADRVVRHFLVEHGVERERR
jgi:hypothetical protein